MRNFLVLFILCLTIGGCGDNDEELIWEEKLIGYETLKVNAEDLRLVTNTTYPIYWESEAYFAEYEDAESLNVTEVFSGDKYYSNDTEVHRCNVRENKVYVLLKEKVSTTIHIEHYQLLDQYNRDVHGKQYTVVSK